MNIEILNKYGIIESKLTNWIRLILTLKRNKNFKEILNWNKQQLNFATYQQPYLTQLQQISLKETNKFNDKTSIFRKLIFTCSNSMK